MSKVSQDLVNQKFGEIRGEKSSSNGGYKEQAAAAFVKNGIALRSKQLVAFPRDLSASAMYTTRLMRRH